jgi:PKD repeat protein
MRLVRILSIAAVAAGALLLAASAISAPRGSSPCPGAAVKVFDNSNGGGVLNGGKPPTFDTKGKSYCLTQIVTYHWNGGHGKTPGSVGLTGANMSASATARGSAGQGGAPNVNWTGTFTNPKPVYIDGAYQCTDSDPASWSQNPASGGKGFCSVYGVLQAGGGSGSSGGTKVGTQITTKVGAPAAPLVSMTPSPTSGAPPLAVTFQLATSVQNVASWGIDFGDGEKGGGQGDPPKVVYHTYKKAGTYKPQFAVKPGQYALVYTVAQITVGGGTAPVLSITAAPTSGKHPLAVKFTLTTSIPAELVSWEVIFGDGSGRTGQGPPPASVTHTYAKAGTYAAYLVIAQQQQYGGVQYTAPRGGLALSVG